MKKLMTVADVFSADDGKTVVAGADHQLDNLSREEFEAVIGSFVMIEHPETQLSGSFSIAGIEISESLAGRKNVFLKLDLPFSGAAAFLGATVLIK